MNTVSDKVSEALSNFQLQVLRALVEGATLFARPDGSVSYLSVAGRMAGKTGFRCLRVIPFSDFRALQGTYIQPTSSVVGTALKIYQLTAVGRHLARGLSHEA